MIGIAAKANSSDLKGLLIVSFPPPYHGRHLVRFWDTLTSRYLRISYRCIKVSKKSRAYAITPTLMAKPWSRTLIKAINVFRKIIDGNDQSHRKYKVYDAVVQGMLNGMESL